ncbi:hypothetical protein [Plesiomonas shigelloides]|uniref:hypothetical protein n=1 Tax=Plesiomonas shigelloides TaxID=703 RepID=UPI001C49C282|nr:hypothetical protein [Plesiomonas shigelloides]
MKILSPSLMLLMTLLITACAHEPKQVDASRPLVTPVNSYYKSMPEVIQAPLNTQIKGATFSSNGVVYTIEERYISALGYQCVKLNYEMNQSYSKRSVACKETDKWYQIPQLEQASVRTLLIEE